MEDRGDTDAILVDYKTIGANTSTSDREEITNLDSVGSCSPPRCVKIDGRPGIDSDKGYTGHNKEEAIHAKMSSACRNTQGGKLSEGDG